MSELMLEHEVGRELEGKDEPVPAEALVLGDVVVRSCCAFLVLLVRRGCGRPLDGVEVWGFTVTCVSVRFDSGAESLADADARLD